MERCENCIWNDAYLCDMFGLFVDDDDMACEHWRKRVIGNESGKTV